MKWLSARLFSIKLQYHFLRFAFSICLQESFDFSFFAIRWWLWMVDHFPRNRFDKIVGANWKVVGANCNMTRIVSFRGASTFLLDCKWLTALLNCSDESGAIFQEWSVSALAPATRSALVLVLIDRSRQLPAVSPSHNVALALHCFLLSPLISLVSMIWK